MAFLAKAAADIRVKMDPIRFGGKKKKHAGGHGGDYCTKTLASRWVGTGVVVGSHRLSHSRSSTRAISPASSATQQQPSPEPKDSSAQQPFALAPLLHAQTTFWSKRRLTMETVHHSGKAKIPWHGLS